MLYLVGPRFAGEAVGLDLALLVEERGIGGPDSGDMLLLLGVYVLDGHQPSPVLLVVILDLEHFHQPYRGILFHLPY